MTEIINTFFTFLEYINNFLWSYFCLAVILIVGFYLTIKSRFLQFKTLFSARKVVNESIASSQGINIGTHPIAFCYVTYT